MKKSIYFLSTIITLILSACNGGSSNLPTPTPSPSPTGVNQAIITVDSGVNNAAPLNRPFVKVTLCVPNTNTCQTIDHVLLDSGSDGLRVPASVLANASLYPQLALQPTNQLLYTCANYAAGYDFGSLNIADVKLGGLVAQAVPFQIIDDSSTQTGVPASCKATGGYFDFIGAGQNAIIGIRNTIYDADLNYTCVNGACTEVDNIPESARIGSPIIRMAGYNNGASIQFPAVPSNGATSFNGILTIGINTQTNNSVPTEANIFYTDDSLFTTNYNNNYQATFDSGTPYIIFSDNSLPICTGGTFEDFYCPASSLTMNVIFGSYTGGNQVNASYQLSNPATYYNNAVANNVLLPYAGAPCVGCEGFANSLFLWGLPYFYGKTIYSIFPGAMVNGESAPALAVVGT